MAGASLLAFDGAAFGLSEGVGSALGYFVLGTLALSALLTAFYMFRLYYFTFSGEYRSAAGGPFANDAHPYEAEPHHEIPAMNLALIVLGVGAIVAGFLGMPHHLHLPNWWGHWMDSAIAHVPGYGPEDHLESLKPIYVSLAIGLTVALGGVGLATALYKGKAEDNFTTLLPKPVFSFLFDKWRVDELYQATILGLTSWLATFSAWIDRTFVDGILAAASSLRHAALVTRSQEYKTAWCMFRHW